MLTFSLAGLGIALSVATCLLTKRGIFDLHHLMLGLFISGGVASGCIWVNA